MGSLRLGELLVRERLITEKQLSEALAQQVLTRDFLGAILVKNGWLTQEALLRALSKQSGIPIVSLKGYYVDWAISHRFIGVIMSEKKFFPLSETNDVVTVAIANPLDVAVTTLIEEYVRPKKIKLVLVSYEELKETLAEGERRSRSNLKNLLDKE